MPYPDEYNTWRCDEPEQSHPGLDCEPHWQHCDCDGDVPDCDYCSGAGGGHVCLIALDSQPKGGQQG